MKVALLGHVKSISVLMVGHVAACGKESVSCDRCIFSSNVAKLA